MVINVTTTNPWHRNKAFWYWRGSRISDIMAKKNGLPVSAKTMAVTAEMASVKLGWATNCQSDLHGPGVAGADSGRPWVPTPMVIVRTAAVSISITRQHDLCNIRATKIQPIPTHANQLMLPIVRMLARQKTVTAGTATNAAVQVACVEIAFKAIDILSKPDAQQNTRTVSNICQQRAERCLYLWWATSACIREHIQSANAIVIISYPTRPNTSPIES